MPKESSYSLWLMPSGKSHSDLVSIIGNLAKTHSTPVFEPHVTLLWPITGTETEIIAKTQKLASFLVPFSVELGKPDWTAEYFRCIFLNAEKTDMLMGSNLKAQELFSQKPANHVQILLSTYGEKMTKETLEREKEPKFNPHLSIMYGNIPQNIKTSIIKGLNIPKMSFRVNSLFLYEITADPKNWRLVKEFRLA